MNMFKKFVLGISIVAGLTTVISLVAATGEVATEVEVEILPGDISIFATGGFDFGSYTVQSSNQTVTGVFVDYFSVEDLKGADSGYYTTLQLSGDLGGPGTATIPASNVSVSVDATTTDLITGQANSNVVVANGMTSWSSLDSSATFIKRDAGANNGLVGQYGSLPNMQVVIPAFSPVGSYTGTLVYTLYEN